MRDVDPRIASEVVVVAKMYKNGENQTDYDQFCICFSDGLPSPSLGKVVNKWSSGQGIDFGSDIVPITLPPADMPLIQFIFAGGAGGVVSRTLTSPMEKVKLIAQTSTSNYKGFRGTCRSVFVNEGFLGLFAGNLTNCMRVFPTTSIICVVNSRMLKYSPVDTVKNPKQPLWRFMSGATAAIIATSATHPLDVIRARLTVQGSTLEGRNYSGIGNAFRTILAEEGARGFYKGMGPSLLSIAPFIGTQQTVYETTKLALTDGARLDVNAFTCISSGCFAGMVAQTVVHPLDVVRRQMQCDRGPVGCSRSTLAAICHLARCGGVTRLYAGLTSAYMKTMPAASISLLVRDTLLGRLGAEPLGRDLVLPFG